MRRAPTRLQAARLLGVDAAPDELGPGSTVREAGWRGAAGPQGGSMTVDHIVYGVEDLEAGVEELAVRLGVRAAPGGKHVGRGTHNALLALGGQSYLEIIARDPDQAELAYPVAFALDRIRLPRLVGWARRVSDIEHQAQRARERGYDPGPAFAMSRRRPHGVVLAWRRSRQTPSPPPHPAPS